MPVIQSVGVLADLDPGWYPSGVYSGVRMYDQYSYDYATLYRQQPNVRTCVDFLARNIAQLGLHVFRRVSETDRVRLRDHPLAQVLGMPMPAQFKVTRYRLIESLVADMGVYFNAYWLKVPTGDNLALMRVPPPYVEVKGGLMPTQYVVTIGTRRLEYAPEQVVHFRGYNAESATTGLSPLETLRRVLAEEHAMGDYREHFWQNAARQAGIIERPPGAPEWSPGARARFKAEFEALYSGGDNSGKTAILEEGMTWKEGTFNAQESEYLGGRKLTREECARAYHIPLPMVGILDHATFCLPAHVPVFTAEGPRPISEIKVGDKVWSHDGDRFVLRPVTRSGKTGIDPILRIRTQNRTLEANPTHPVLVRRLVRFEGVPDPGADAKTRAGQSRWHYEARHVYVPAGEIERGDILVVLSKLPEGSQQQSLSRMEFYGLLLGDGNVYPDRGSVSIARANNAPYMDHYRRVMRSEFESFGRSGNGTSREGLQTQPVTLVEGDRQTRFVSVVVAEELTELGLSGTAHTKRVPGWVFGATRAERLALLRGYLDSDGSVDKRGKITYSSCNRALIEDIRHLCMSLGIPVNNAYHRVGQTTLPTGDIGDVDQWAITCSDPAANRLIGSHNPRHQERLDKGKAWDKKGKDYPFAKGRRSDPPQGCAYSRVVQIEELPAEPIYDIEVEGTHSFIAAGVIVHNSNIKEQHKNLYQDSLGPWLAMFEQDIELQLLPDFEDTQGVYVEFNIAEKLQGSFEEQTAAMQGAVGRPWMTANEARARFNMPSLDGDADELVTPLNVLVGGQASALDSAPKARLQKARLQKDDDDSRFTIHKSEAVVVDPTQPGLRTRYQEKWARLMVRTFDRQRAAVEGKLKDAGRAETKEIPDIAVLWDRDRWNTELTGDFLKLGLATASAWAQFVAGQLDVEFDDEQMLPWLQENARIGAEYVNATTLAEVEAALLQDEPESALARVFELAMAGRASQIATSRVTSLANFGSQDAARAGGLRQKTWRVNSTNPRPDHAALNGVSVGIRENFPNGLRWPGDPRGTADDNANCECSVVFGQ